MNPYIEHTRFAANGLIELYTHEATAYKNSERSFIVAAEAASTGSAASLLKYLGNTVQIRESVEKMREIEAVLKTQRQLAFEVLCGALLQIVKQGISLTYGSSWETTCPAGRAIGSETLRNVIWRARNQAMHYEDDRISEAVRKCFANLEKCFGEKFSLSVKPSVNLAAHVIDLLKWHSYDAYLKDLNLLGIK